MTQQRIPTEQEVKDILFEQLQAGQITKEQAAQKMSSYRQLVAGQSQPQQAIDQPRQLSQEDPSLRDRVLGDIQAAGQVVAGAVAEPIAGLSGLAVGAVTGDPEQAASAVEAVRRFPEQALPLNPTGQRRIEQLSRGVEGIIDTANRGAGFLVGAGEAVRTGSIEQGVEAGRNVAERGVSDALGTAVLNTTGSPELATAAFLVPTASLEAVGVKGARNLKGQTILGRERDILSSGSTQAFQQASPTIKQLKKRAGDLYSEIDQAGQFVNKEDYFDFALKLQERLFKEGYDPRVADEFTKQTRAVMQLIEDDIAGDLTLTNIDNTRRLANIAKMSDEAQDSRLGSIIVEEMDNFLDAQEAKIFDSGNTEVASKFKQARSLWQKASKAEIIDGAIQRADRQASGFENGLRSQFRSIMNNDKLRNQFTKAEQAAMDQIVKGTGMANMFTQLGALGFGDGQRRNLIGIALGIGGGSFAGPLGSVTMPAVGTISGKLATRLQSGKATMLADVVKAGNNGKDVAAAYLKHTPKAERSISELTELLMRPDVDLGALKKGPITGVVADAIFMAEQLRGIGAANLIEVPAIIEGIRQEEQQ